MILSNAILAIGLLFVIEGILVALAPVYLEKILKVLVKASYEREGFNTNREIKYTVQMTGQGRGSTKKLRERRLKKGE